MDRSNKTLRVATHRVIGLVALALAALFTFIPTSYGQQADKETVLTHVPFKTVSAEIIRFKKPIRLGVGKRFIEYPEALVLSIDISQKDYEALPPSIAPYLYIGTREYRIFHVGRAKEKNMLRLTFHIRDFADIPDRAQMVLTIMQGAPISNPELFTKFKLPKFSKAFMKDKRQ